MSKQFFYISGLPRTCSTLLCNILAQNPEFYVSKATSACHDVLFNIRNQWDRLIEHQAEGIDYERLRKVLLAALEAYHGTDKKIVFDKGRGWVSLIEMIEFTTQKKCKIIVPVRSMPEVFASFETLWRNSAGQTQWNIEQSDFFLTQTVAGRCEVWGRSDHPVGLAYNRIKDAVARGYRDRLYFMEMDNLTADPEKEMRKIYSFIELPYFNHDFKNVVQVTKEDDIGVHRIPDLHTIRKEVKPVPPKALQVLGLDLVNKYSNTEFWRQL